MKKSILMLAAAFAVTAGLTACGGAAKSGNDSAKEESSNLDTRQEMMMKSFEKETEKLNEQLPMELNDGLKMQKVELKDGYFVYYCTYPSGQDFEIVDDPATKKSIISSIGAPTLNRLKELNLGIRYVYMEEGTSNEQVITITPEEL